MPGSPKLSLFRGARAALLIVLLCAAGLGVLMDVWAVMEYRWEQVHGSDGLGMFFPMIAVVVFAPLQLAAALAVSGGLRRRRQAQLEAAEPALSTGPVEGVDDRIFERERAAKMVGRAHWLLGVPAAALAIAVLLHRSGLDWSLVYVLAEPLSFLWFPSWCGGVLAAAIAFGRYDEWAPLALAPLYPLLCFVYGAS